MPTPKQHETNADRQAAYRARAAAARAAERAAKGLTAAPTLPTMPSRARWKALLESARAALDTAAEEMQTYHDDRSETWQEGDRAAQMLETIDGLQNLVSEMEGMEI